MRFTVYDHCVTCFLACFSFLAAPGERTPKVARNRHQPERTPAARPGVPAAAQHPRLVQAVLDGQGWRPPEQPQRPTSPAGNLRRHRNPAQTQLGRRPVDRPQLEDDLAQLAGFAPVRPEPRHAESVRAQPHRRPDRLLPVVHVPSQLEPDVAERFDARFVHPRRTQRQRHQRLLDGVDDGRGDGRGRWRPRHHPELVPAAVPRVAKSGEAVAAADARREVREEAWGVNWGDGFSLSEVKVRSCCLHNGCSVIVWSKCYAEKMDGFWAHLQSSGSREMEIFTQVVVAQ